jgi:predicted DCC family thiol-disulfide oxidoreductase YuxK
MTREAPCTDTLVQVSESHPIILFDGVCNLCNASVQWIIARDTRDVFRFAALQSEAGKQALAAASGDVSLAHSLSSMVVIDNGRVMTKSDAAIVIASRLGAVAMGTDRSRATSRTARLGIQLGRAASLPLVWQAGCVHDADTGSSREVLGCAEAGVMFLMPMSESATLTDTRRQRGR